MDLKYIFLVFAITVNSFADMRPTPSAIYGDDSRQESLHVNNAKLIEASFSVAALVPFYDLYESLEDINEEQSLEEQLLSVRGKVDEETYNFLLGLLRTSNETAKEENEKDSFRKSVDKKMSNAALLRYHLSKILASKRHEPFYEFDQEKTIVSELNVCPSQKFTTQPILSVCTGFLIGKDRLLTAGHCMKTQRDCEDGLWVFEFFKDAKKIPSRNIYRCKKIISRNEGATFLGKDYAIIQLEREVKNRKVLKVQKSKSLRKNGKVAVIGHPLGLPMKTALGKITSAWFGPYFKTNLDTFVGNSGSPVFNLETAEVIGLLVGGAEDFSQHKSEQCLENLRIYGPKGRERVLKISKIPGI